MLDDTHEIDGATGSWRFVEALVRFAPDNLHVLLVSRNDPPFGVERLRAQGEVSDIGGAALAFTAHEIETLVSALLPADVVPRDATGDAAARILSATNGWPAAVRLTIEALRSAPSGGREAVLDRLQRPEGPLFAYLAEEVVAAASDAVRATLARAVHFERFSGPLLEAAGLAHASRELDGLARRGLFLQPLPGDPGWFALHGLIREYAKARLPLPDDEIRALHLRAATWLEAQGRHDDALAQLVAGDAPEELAAFLDRHAPMLVLAGSTRAVTEAAATLPDELRSVRLERACGEAYMVRGDWRNATRSFTRAAGGGQRLDPMAAWRLGLVHGLRGAYDEALAIYARAELTGEEPAEEGLLFAWIASAHYHRGDVRESAEAAEQGARVRGRLRRCAVARRGPYRDRHERGAGPRLQRRDARVRPGARVRGAGGRRAPGGPDPERPRRARDRPGGRQAAFTTLDQAVRLAEAVGFASFHARALVNRGRAHQGLGRFEEALADFSAAREIYDRVGSPSVAYPLVREGNLHLLRGDPLLARFAFEQRDPRGPRRRGCGGARAGAASASPRRSSLDEPDRARELAAESRGARTRRGAADRAPRRGPRPRRARRARHRPATGAARRPTCRGPPGPARVRRRASRSRPRRRTSVGEAELLCERAAAVWTAANIPYGYARNRLILASILDGDRARAAAEDAAGMFRSLGARGPASEADRAVETLDRAGRPALEIGALGRFRVAARRRADPAHGVAVEEGARPAQDPRRRGAAARRPARRCSRSCGPTRTRSRSRTGCRSRSRRCASVLDPEKRFAADWFIGGDKQAVWLDLGHVELDIEAFLAPRPRACGWPASGEHGAVRARARGGRGPLRRRVPRGGPVRGLGGRCSRGGAGGVHLA